MKRFSNAVLPWATALLFAANLFTVHAQEVKPTTHFLAVQRGENNLFAPPGGPVPFTSLKDCLEVQRAVNKAEHERLTMAGAKYVCMKIEGEQV